MKIGSKVRIVGAEDSEGKLIRFDPEGLAIVETKKRVMCCLPEDLILIK